ncbi:MAG: ABC transporter ATP-binding protein [Candidatus Hydrogenedentes bacterium]|nr:ABC transporter ATP-binding protein [Candidatus Hydrogenedentota bacterium]
MIRTEGLTKIFGEKVAVKNLTMEIPRGTFFCFLGPNGAGKTTTIKMLTGLMRPTKGRAFIGGIDIQENPVEAKKLIGFVPDHPFLYDKLTGREFLKFVAGLYRISEPEYKERMEELIHLFELTQVIDELIEDYSHGMRQKLSFTACFLHKPEVVIVDEPWVGLDPKNIRFVKNYLKEKTRSEELTVFMSTHTLGIAEEIADIIGIIHNGSLCAFGSVEQIKALSDKPGNLEDVFLELTKDTDEVSMRDEK